MAIYWTPFIDIGVDTDIYAAGDALGPKQSFTSVPEFGVIMAVSVIDRDSEEVNLDVVLFKVDLAGSANNAAFAPSDAELAECVGAVLVNTWKTFSDNSLGVVDNVGLPYWAPSGTLFFQCVTRGIPTYTDPADVHVSLSIVH